MADTHVDRTDTVLRSKNRPDDLTLMDKWRFRTAFDARSAMFSDQAAFSTTDCRKIANQSHVTGDAEAPRMRESVAIAQEAVGGFAELSKGGNDGRRLPERQEAWDVRECKRLSRPALFHDGLFFGVPQNDSRQAAFTVTRERHVHTRDEPY